jgi:hypothetical protein
MGYHMGRRVEVQLVGSHHRWYQQHHQQEQLPVFRIRLSYVSKLFIYVYIADLISMILL